MQLRIESRTGDKGYASVQNTVRERRNGCLGSDLICIPCVLTLFMGSTAMF